MLPRTRKLILTLLVITFIALGPGAVLYANGWRLDASRFRLLKVGGIILRDNHRDSIVKVDSAPARNERQHLLAGTFLGNLLPSVHKIEIDRAGFRHWEKYIEVRPAEVSETNSIILVRENPVETPVLEKPVKNFWINQSELVYKDAADRYFLTDLDNALAKTDFAAIFNDLKQRLLKFPGYVIIQDIAPAEKPSQWIVSSSKANYLLDTEALTIEILKKKPAGAVSLLQDRRLPNRDRIAYASPHSNPGYVFVQYPNQVYLLELDGRDPLNLQLVADGVTKHTYSNSRLYILRPSGISYIEI